MTKDELEKKIRPFLDEVCILNKKYRWPLSTVFSSEDRERSNFLWQAMRNLDLEYDKAHPLSPCPECGSERRSSIFDGICPNIKKCKLAPIAIGG